MRVTVVLFLLLAGTSDSQAKRVKGVKSLDDKAWDEIIGGPRPVLVMFYKDNCPNCAHFNVSYRAIGRVFRDEPRVVIANVHLDHTFRLQDGLISRDSRTHWPTLKFYPRKKKEPAFEINGNYVIDMSIEDILSKVNRATGLSLKLTDEIIAELQGRATERTDL